MNLELLINNYGIYLLILIFILYSIYKKNYKHIIIFLILFILLAQITSLKNSIFISYILIISYGIIENFHLIENFNDTQTENLNKLEPFNQENIGDELEENKNINNDLDTKLSSNVLNKFIDELKTYDSSLIKTIKVSLHLIKPINKYINKTDIYKFKQNNKLIKNTKIIISNDNFILNEEGHNLWFIKKNNIDKNMKVIQIDYSVKRIFDKLKEFKIKYNDEYFKSAVNEINNNEEIQQIIENMKININNLDNKLNLNKQIKII